MFHEGGILKSSQHGGVDQPPIFSSWLPFAGLDEACEDPAAETEGLEEPTLGDSSLADLCCSRTSIYWGRSPMNTLQDSLYSSLIDLQFFYKNYKRILNRYKRILLKNIFTLFGVTRTLCVCWRTVLSTGDSKKNVTLSWSSDKLQSSRWKS